MGDIKEPNVSDFVNFQKLNYKEKLKLCYVKNNIDSLIISKEDNQITSIISSNLSGASNLEGSSTNILSMYPKSQEEEDVFFEMFEEEQFFRGRYGSKTNDVVHEFDFLRDNWLLRYKTAIVRSDYLENELDNIKSKFELSNKHSEPYKSFFDLGVRQSEIGLLNYHYFWDKYYENNLPSTFHKLLSSARIYYSGFYLYQYYAFLRNFNTDDYLVSQEWEKNKQKKLKGATAKKEAAPLTKTETMLIPFLIKEIKKTPTIGKTDLANSFNQICSPKTVFNFFKKMDKETVKSNEFTATYIEKYRSNK